MNSHVERCVVGLYGALLKDFLYVHPTVEQEITWFNNHGASLVSSRGLGFFTMTLPDCGKYFRKCLAAGRLLDDRPPYHGAVSKTDHRPKFLRTLWSLIFDVDGMLRSDDHTSAVFALNQLYSFAKKLKLDCSEEKVNEAFSELASIDSSMPASHPDTWDSDVPVWINRFGHPVWGPRVEDPDSPDLPFIRQDGEASYLKPDRRWDVYRELCFRVTRSMGEMDLWGMRPKHGPGAVSDAERYKYMLSHWPRKLEGIFHEDWFGSPDLTVRSKDDREVPCRVIAVPKTQKTPRIIAAEPTAHQWCQGGIQRWMTQAIRASRILKHSINLNDQNPSRVLALSGSATGDIATIDLSNASDRLSTRLVEYTFQGRQDVLDVLHATRSRLARFPDGSQINLRKFAMAGSSCTFPVQTIVFTCLSLFSLVELSGDYKLTDARLAGLAKHVRVFGDDIIVPVEAYDALESILTDVLLKVNPQKSYRTGWFRESCGMDAYKGDDVTPAYFLQPYSARNPESLGSLTNVANNFHQKGCWNAADYLLKTLDAQMLRNIRVANRDVSQPFIYSYSGTQPAHKVRWNRDLHIEEGKFLLLQSKEKWNEGAEEAAVLQFFTEEPDPSYMYRSGCAQRPKHRLTLRWVALGLEG